MSTRIKQKAAAGKNKFKNSFANLLELPKEVLLDLPKISLVGDLQLQLENHRGIIEFTEGKVRINTKVGVVTVTGEGLVLRNITDQEIMIDGKIQVVSYK